MIRKLLFVGLCFIIFGVCYSKPAFLSSPKRVHFNDTINNDTTHIKAPLLYCLLDYIKNYDTIRNSWGATPIYTLGFQVKGTDTLLSISAHKTRPLIVDKNLEVKGLFYIKGAPILITDKIKSVGNSLYKKEKLLKDIEVVDKERKIYRFERKTLPTWIYLYKQNSILLIEKKEGVILK